MQPTPRNEEHGTRMRYVLGAAALAAVLWIGTANFAQAFG
jgi:hypothetical protein